MVSFVLKMNKILTFLILTIIFFSFVLIGTFMYKSRKIQTPEEYLKSLGYDVEYINEKNVNIPENFGEGLREYNEIQKKQGFNLEKYCGKECVQKQYYVTSKKIYPEKYVANMLTYRNKLIGGDLHSRYYKQRPLKLKSIR